MGARAHSRNHKFLRSTSRSELDRRKCGSPNTDAVCRAKNTVPGRQADCDLLINRIPVLSKYSRKRLRAVDRIDDEIIKERSGS